MRLRTAALALACVLPACATAPLPSKASFSEQVLAPIARAQANEIIDELKAKAMQSNGKLGSLIYRGSDWLVFSQAGTQGAGFGVETFLKMSGEQKAARLDNQRAPLRAQLLTLLEGRVHEQDSGKVFVVCTSGKERRYARQTGFPRLDDGHGPCEATKLTLAG